jgi:hypothetical protein
MPGHTPPRLLKTAMLPAQLTKCAARSKPHMYQSTASHESASKYFNPRDQETYPDFNPRDQETYLDFNPRDQETYPDFNPVSGQGFPWRLSLDLSGPLTSSTKVVADQSFLTTPPIGSGTHIHHTPIRSLLLVLSLSTRGGNDKHVQKWYALSFPISPAENQKSPTFKK